MNAVDALPPALERSLDGSDLRDKVGETFLLCTAGVEGWPHVAMLSVGELIATSARELRMALHAGSSTSANLERTGRGTLLAVLDGRAVTVRVRAATLDVRRVAGLELRFFSARVAELIEHKVGYAELESGVRFRLTEVDGTLRRWEQTLAALRGSGTCV